jgi:amino acid permease
VEKAKSGYQMTLNMVGILGQEIYSIFNAMLTANSIIITAYVLTFSENNNMPGFLNIFLPVFGIVLCLLWFVFIQHGIYRQRQYRNEGKRIEEVYFKSSFRLLRMDYSKDPCLL